MRVDRYIGAADNPFILPHVALIIKTILAVFARCSNIVIPLSLLPDLSLICPRIHPRSLFLIINRLQSFLPRASMADGIDIHAGGNTLPNAIEAHWTISGAPMVANSVSLPVRQT